MIDQSGYVSLAIIIQVVDADRIDDVAVVGRGDQQQRRAIAGHGPVSNSCDRADVRTPCWQPDRTPPPVMPSRPCATEWEYAPREGHPVAGRGAAPPACGVLRRWV